MAGRFVNATFGQFSFSVMDSPAYTDSPVYDRNPSPPPEILEHSELLSEERIGDTVFSKHWLFTTLMKLIEVLLTHLYVHFV